MNNWFQTDECYNFYKFLPFLEAFNFEVERDGEVKGRIVGYVQKDGGKLKQFFSRRAIINGGPYLAEDITDTEVAELLERCKSGMKGKCIYVETRNFESYSEYKDVFKSVGFEYEPHYNFKIDTSSIETVREHLGKSRKRDIRTSLRDGAEIVEAQNIDEVRELYLLLQNLYRTKVKTPLFPFVFFEQLFHSEFGKILLVKSDGAILGGTVLVCGSNTIYEWFVCGLENNAGGIYPSTLATYGGIQYAATHGYKCFDMMGAGAPGDGGYGVRDFKAKFGGELVEFGRFKCTLNHPLYAIGCLGVKFLKRH